jgi:monovalent cation:H+ antiporter-2, CPA2 family
MQDWHLLFSIVTLLAGAFVLGLVFERIRLSAILGYLAAGMILGPHALGFIAESHSLEIMAELGVTLLLFTVGLEFSARRLMAMGSVVLVGGALQILLTTALIAVSVVGFGVPVTVGVAIGLILAPSSTACVLRLLVERAESESVHGRNATGILLLQDVALVPMVLTMAALGGEGTPVEVISSMVLALGVLALLVLGFQMVSRVILPRLLTMAALVRNRELLALLAVITAFGAAWVTHDLGLSPALGAFIAGMLLAESPFAAQMRADVGILRVLFVTLFFAATGMLADLPWMAFNLPLVLGSVAAIMGGKLVIVWTILWMMGITHRYAFATGMLMACAGEFGFVLAQMAYRSDVLDEPLFRLLAASIIVTMALTPLMVAKADTWGLAVERLLTGKGRAGDERASRGSGHLRDHVVIIGYGPAGRGVVNALRGTGVVFVILELNPRTVAAAKRDGLRAELGDAAQADVLEHLHVADARAVVITIPDHNGVLNIIRSVVSEAPKTTIVARARYHIHGPSYLEAGAHVVLDEEELVGVVLGERVLGSMSPRSMSGILEKPRFDDELIHGVEEGRMKDEG